MSRFGMFFGKKVGLLAQEAERAIGHNTLIGRLNDVALNETVEYVRTEMGTAFPFEHKENLWEFVLDKIKLSNLVPGSESSPEGLNLEFGVHKGRSINWMSSLTPERKWFGFDSFEGLAEDWPGIGMRKGTFDLLGQMPRVNDNVTLVKGWFSETLETFLENHTQNVDLLHLDADTYESTLYVLNALRGRIRPGTWIIFDEYFNYNGWKKTGEFKAFSEWVANEKVTYVYEAFASREVAVKITDLAS